MKLALSSSSRSKKAIGAATVLLCSLLRLGLAGATGIEASALILQDKNDKALQSAINLNLAHVEDSIGQLERSLDSLAEIALQNRRSLDLSEEGCVLRSGGEGE